VRAGGDGAGDGLVDEPGERGERPPGCQGHCGEEFSKV
jgi:hypothetical protein